MLWLLASAMVTSGVVLAGLAGYVSWRRGSSAGASLAVLLLAVAWWGFAYAVELSASDLAIKGVWGDLKYIGISALVPAWLVFVLQYTGRERWVTKPLLVALTVEPLLLLALLANDATHDLVRFYPKSASGEVLPVVGTGPLFWVHLIYANLIILTATGLFVWTMVKVSRLYRKLAATLVAAALLPWVANLLYNLGVGVFARIDLTPFAFIVTGAVLVWGLFRERLVNLTPVARGVIVDSMSDAVFVLDAFGRIVDANPAAAGLVGRPRAELIGRSRADVLPPELAVEPENGTDVHVALIRPDSGEQQHFDARSQHLVDRGGSRAGELVVLRDVTERMLHESQLREVASERSRVAAALQASLLPDLLPQIPGSELAGLYEPAGDGAEIGGDFFDVFPLDDGAWGIMLGDVSGKGAEAAAITALARYTLRTLASATRLPSDTLRELNTRLLRATTDERHCTLVYAVVRPCALRIQMTMCLGGHHPPLVFRASGTVEPVGELGTALGLTDEPDLYDAKVDLGPGDLICLFTDGLVEARNGLDMFGSDRTAAVLCEHRAQAPGDLVRELAGAAKRFHGSLLADDLALLALRVD